MSDNTINVTLAKIPDSVDKIIDGIAVPPAKEIGTVLADICVLVFGAINQNAAKRKLKYVAELQKFQEDLFAKVAAIPEDKRVEPDVQVVAQALESAKYCAEHEELRNMFANLIAASMNIDTVNDVHPSFAETIRQMNSLDAENLTLFNFENNYPIALIQYANKIGKKSFVFNNIFIANSKRKDLVKQARSISALNMLGLISIDYVHTLADEALYDPFYNLQKHDIFNETIPENFCERELIKGHAQLTPYGEQFIEVCLA